MAAGYWESLQSAKQADPCLRTIFANVIFFLVGHFLCLPSFVDAVLSLVVSKPSNTPGKRPPSELYSRPLPVLRVAPIGLELTLESRKALSLSVSCPSFSNPWDYRLYVTRPSLREIFSCLVVYRDGACKQVICVRIQRAGEPSAPMTCFPGHSPSGEIWKLSTSKHRFHSSSKYMWPRAHGITSFCKSYSPICKMEQIILIS